MAADSVPSLIPFRPSLAGNCAKIVIYVSEMMMNCNMTLYRQYYIRMYVYNIYIYIYVFQYELSHVP